MVNASEVVLFSATARAECLVIVGGLATVRWPSPCSPFRRCRTHRTCTWCTNLRLLKLVHRNCAEEFTACFRSQADRARSRCRLRRAAAVLARPLGAATTNPDRQRIGKCHSAFGSVTAGLVNRRVSVLTPFNAILVGLKALQSKAGATTAMLAEAVLR